MVLKTQYVVLWCVLLTFFYGCQLKGKDKKVDFLDNPELSTQRKIALLLHRGHPKLPITYDDRMKLYKYYKTTDFKPFFIDSSQVEVHQNWSKTIEKSEYFGIPNNRIKYNKNSHHIIEEIMLTYQIGTMIHDLDHGFIRLDTALYKTPIWEKIPQNWLTANANSDSLFLSRGPLDTNYRYFSSHLYHYRDTVRLDTLTYKVTDEKKDKKRAWKEVKLALNGLGLINAATDSTNIRLALKNYQRSKGLNPDGKIGPSTILAFATSKRISFDLAMLELDRLRQKEELPATFVQVNIPSFTLKYINDNKLCATHRVIVGKVNHQTPTLKSKITHIISLPYWKVPSSIAKHEILPALKRNPNYLANQNMRIFKSKDQEVDPSSVNWKNIKTNTFPYQVIQDPGQKNSLGLVKFVFSNNFSVYIHDTPSRSLFNQQFRSFSHGCMRADKPIDLAKTILELDKVGNRKNRVDPDSLQVLLDEEVHQQISLQRAIPVFVTYRSVICDQNGLYFYLDLYEKEAAYLKLLGSRNNG